jgi:propionyl-CoA synthetase
VVRDNGGHAVALRRSMTNIYDTGPGDVFWAASDVGWVVGHSYIVYAPLLSGCTTVPCAASPTAGMSRRPPPSRTLRSSTRCAPS